MKRAAATITVILATALLLFVQNQCVEAFALKNIRQQQTRRHVLRTGNATRKSVTTTRLQAKSSNLLESLLSGISNVASTKVLEKQPTYENVVIEPDYRIPILFLGAGILLDFIPYIQLTLGPFITLLGVLFFVQSFRIRFVFTDDNKFELKTVSPLTKQDSADGLQDSGENVIVGGANSWDCNTIVNYDFFPKSMMDFPFLGQPILIYFKETQTPESTWNEGPGKIANDPEKVQGGLAIPGQVHFFPAICNAQQVKEEFQKRSVQKL
jgi:hypothetical protein